MRLKKSLSIVKKITKWTLLFIGLFLLYVLGSLLYGTITDFQPGEKITLEQIQTSPNKVIDKAELSFVNWNVGYGGLGKESNFFFDNGGFFFSGQKMVRAPKKYVEKNIKGIHDFIKKQAVDFVLLQEVDQESKRSYYIDQFEKYSNAFDLYNKTFAINFRVDRVPLPVCEPWNVMGQMESGLATFSKYEAAEAIRYQFPGSYGWPDYIFHLDRCMAVHRYKTTHPDAKDLLVINTHNSAYDGGILKKKEMDYLKKFILSEYEKGNYVLVGGDWNQCPPNFPFNKLMPQSKDSTNYNPGNIENNFLPKNWTWAYDPLVATNRKLKDSYEPKKTFKTLIDFYVVSPNIEIVQVKTTDLDFEYSDHQPVSLKVRLKDMPLKNSVESVADTSLLVQ